MPTECSATRMGFARVDGRAVVADFDGGAITSNADGLLLGNYPPRLSSSVDFAFWLAVMPRCRR